MNAMHHQRRPVALGQHAQRQRQGIRHRLWIGPDDAHGAYDR